MNFARKSVKKSTAATSFFLEEKARQKEPAFLSIGSVKTNLTSRNIVLSEEDPFPKTTLLTEAQIKK